jgi:hypothetical protein
MTTKVGFDCTKSLETKGKGFEKVKFPDVDVTKFFEEG